MLAETCKHKFSYITHQSVLSTTIKTYPTRIPEVDEVLQNVISFHCMDCGTDIVCDANKAPEWLRDLIKRVYEEISALVPDELD